MAWPAAAVAAAVGADLAPAAADVVVAAPAAPADPAIGPSLACACHSANLERCRRSALASYRRCLEQQRTRWVFHRLDTT